MRTTGGGAPAAASSERATGSTSPPPHVPCPLPREECSLPALPGAALFAQRLKGTPWCVLPLLAGAGPEHMATDEALLNAAAQEAIPPTLRFYTWSPPAVSLGRFQRPEGIHLDYATARGWDIVRRPTGGRGVLHQHELTYAIVLPPSVVHGVGVRSSYAVLTGLLEAGLSALLGRCERSAEGRTGNEPDSSAAGATASGSAARTLHQPNCFALPAECDTLVGGRKLVGSAQVRRDGALLQHGAILLDAEPEAWQQLFQEVGRVITLRDLLGARPSPECVIAALCGGLERAGIAFRSSKPGDGAGDLLRPWPERGTPGPRLSP